MSQCNRQGIDQPGVLSKRAPKKFNSSIMISLCLFTFLIPLEGADPLGFSESFSIAKMAGGAFCVLFLIQSKLCIARPPQAFWGFAIYATIVAAEGLFCLNESLWDLSLYLLTLTQNILMFWLVYNIMKDRKVAEYAMLSCGIGCAVLSLAMLTIGTTDQFGDRLTVFRENPNTVAFYISIGLLISTSFAMRTNSFKVLMMLLLCPVFLLMISQVVQTGSRGGMLCAGVGIMCFLFGKGGCRNKALLVCAVAGILVVGIQRIQESDVALSRWQYTFENGDVATRDDIITQSVFMFMEKPVLGWMPVEHLKELGSRTARTGPKDTHNDILWVVTSVGVVGAIPFLIAVGYCVVGAWHGRKTDPGILSLALVGAVVVMSMSGTVHNRKMFWLVFAYAAAVARYPVVGSSSHGWSSRNENKVIH